MTQFNQLNMPGHTECLLCLCWQSTHHSRFVTTPVQPAEAEMLMVRGFWTRAKTPEQSISLCQKHEAVLDYLKQAEGAKPTLIRQAAVTPSAANSPTRAPAAPAWSALAGATNTGPTPAMAVVPATPTFEPTLSMHAHTPVHVPAVSAPTRQLLADVQLSSLLTMSGIDRLSRSTTDPPQAQDPREIPIPPQPVFGQPVSVPCPSCGAAIGSMCKTNDGWGWHKIRIEMASPEQGKKSEAVTIQTEPSPGS